MWRAGALSGRKRGQPAGAERRTEAVARHLRERRPVRVRVADQVERYVDAAGRGRHGVGVRVDGVWVKRVDDRGLGAAAGFADLRRELRERALGAAGEED